MITAISIGVAVGVFLYKTSILNISKLSNGLLYGPIIFSATFIDICTLINKDMARSSRSSRNSLTIRSKVTLNRILEITNNSVRIEINEKGTITGRYSGNQIATIDNSANQDGTSSWNGKFMQMTNRGDMIVATGSGTGEPPNSKGIVKIRGEGDMWTHSTRLANLNGAKWTCEGESNIRKGSSVIRVDIKN